MSTFGIGLNYAFSSFHVDDDQTRIQYDSIFLTLLAVQERNDYRRVEN